jgi:bifunctional DNA-binding transcriptional regulator/antitoxin component of YhaV-PrlF toxin-antitoxin module
MRKFVTVSYQYGTITVPQYSRIRINLKSGRMVYGFFVREVNNNFVVIIPSDVAFFQKGIVRGFRTSIYKGTIRDFKFDKGAIVSYSMNPNNSVTNKGGNVNVPH